mmetsp:Transcript_51191/g.122617  ORF Transcript_51191/g.122617 Transcript_51191/m.122617 type:complete len:266 (-) Transcript_51191:200-997(-)
MADLEHSASRDHMLLCVLFRGKSESLVLSSRHHQRLQGQATLLPWPFVWRGFARRSLRETAPRRSCLHCAVRVAASTKSTFFPLFQPTSTSQMGMLSAIGFQLSHPNFRLFSTLMATFLRGSRETRSRCRARRSNSIRRSSSLTRSASLSFLLLSDKCSSRECFARYSSLLVMLATSWWNLSRRLITSARSPGLSNSVTRASSRSEGDPCAPFLKARSSSAAQLSARLFSCRTPAVGEFRLLGRPPSGGLKRPLPLLGVGRTRGS